MPQRLLPIIGLLFTILLLDAFAASASQAQEKELGKPFRPLKVIDAEDGKLQWVEFSPDGRYVAACGDRYVQMFDVKSGQRVRQLAGHSSDIFRFSFSPNGMWIASGSRDNTVHVWNIDTGEIVRVLRGHTDRIIGVKFSADSRWLASASANHDGTIRIWDTSNWEKHAEVRAPANTNAMYVAFSPDSRAVATSEYRGGVRLYSFDEKALKLRHAMSHDGGEMTPHVQFTADGSTIVTSSWDRTARAWSVTTGKQQWKINAPPYARCFEASAFSPDGSVLYLVTRDETIQARDAKTRKLIRARRWNDEVRGLAVSSDSKTLATAGHRGQIKLWAASDFKN